MNREERARNSANDTARTSRRCPWTISPRLQTRPWSAAAATATPAASCLPKPTAPSSGSRHQQSVCRRTLPPSAAADQVRMALKRNVTDRDTVVSSLATHLRRQRRSLGLPGSSTSACYPAKRRHRQSGVLGPRTDVTVPSRHVTAEVSWARRTRSGHGFAPAAPIPPSCEPVRCAPGSG